MVPSGVFIKKYLISWFAGYKGIIVLMYHRVNECLPADDLNVPPPAFRRQMEYLQKHCRVIGLEELLEAEDWRPLYGTRGRPTVLITFDDGYRDNYLNAFPVLKEFGFPATIFLTTGFIGTDKKFNRYAHLAGRDMLNWEEVAEMHSHKISFGAHTVSHPHLPRLSFDQQKKEIRESRQCLDQSLPSGERLSAFCYPYGEYNVDTLCIVRELGFKCALSVISGVNTQETSRHELRRIEVSGLDNVGSFKYELFRKIQTG